MQSFCSRKSLADLQRCVSPCVQGVSDANRLGQQSHEGFARSPRWKAKRGRAIIVQGKGDIMSRSMKLVVLSATLAVLAAFSGAAEARDCCKPKCCKAPKVRCCKQERNCCAQAAPAPCATACAAAPCQIQTVSCCKPAATCCAAKTSCCSAPTSCCGSAAPAAGHGAPAPAVKEVPPPPKEEAAPAPKA